MPMKENTLYEQNKQLALHKFSTYTLIIMRGMISMLICTTGRIIDIAFENFNENVLFRPFITKEVPPKLILPLQMTKEIMDKIHAQKQEYINHLPPRIHRYFSFFDNIREGEWFYIFPEELLHCIKEDNRGKFADWHQVYLRYKNMGVEEEKISEYMKEFGERLNMYLAPLENLYEIECYTSRQDKLYLGEKEKSKRVCRFCGRTKPKVTFKDAAHAIPLALGNHIFFNNYECDSCNHFFGEEIEPHLRQWIATMIFFSRTRGRSGVPDLIFENGMMKYDNDKNLFIIVQKGNGTGKDPKTDGQEAEIPLIQLGDGTPYIPSKAYKALVKIALSFIPDEKMKMFENTVSWIMNKEDNRDLPKIAYMLSTKPVMNPQPEITLFLRKEDSPSDIPYAVAFLSMCGMDIVYIIPFCISDGTNFALPCAYEKYWSTFALYSAVPGWNFENLSRNTAVTPRLNLRFQQNKNSL